MNYDAQELDKQIKLLNPQETTVSRAKVDVIEALGNWTIQKKTMIIEKEKSNNFFRKIK